MDAGNITLQARMKKIAFVQKSEEIKFCHISLSLRISLLGTRKSMRDVGKLIICFIQLNKIRKVIQLYTHNTIIYTNILVINFCGFIKDVNLVLKTRINIKYW